MKKLLLGSLVLVGSLFGSGDVLAVVNGEKVTKQEINALLAPQKITYDKLPEQYKKKVLDDIINQALLIQKAEKSGITKTDEYKKELEKVKKQLALKLFLKNKLDNMKVLDRDLKSFYNKNRDLMFKQPAEVKARHILVKTEAEAKKLINQLRKVPKNKLEAKFIELAKEHSIGPSKIDGGELGWFSKGKMIPTFSEAAFNLNKGNITLKPVKTRFGYHIIYVEDKKSGGYISFDKVKDKISKQLKMKKFQEYLEKVKKSAKIKYY
jgi:peptidylprolyl isomerase